MGAFAMNPAKYSRDCGVSGPVTGLVFAFMPAVFAARANAAENINGQVLGAGIPIANSTVTLWAASAGAPKQLAQTRTGADGHFALTSMGAPGNDVSLYLIARGGTPTANQAGGDNSMIGLITVLGSAPSGKVTINEMTTVASVW